jgi:hypothetical protein
LVIAAPRRRSVATMLLQLDVADAQVFSRVVEPEFRARIETPACAKRLRKLNCSVDPRAD